MQLGVNGLGRIGKLTLWHHIGRKYFDDIVVNIGRDVGMSLKDIGHYLERDSTYGSLGSYLYGHRSEEVLGEVNEKTKTITVDGTRIHFLQKTRNPGQIEWKERGIRLVVDSTGKFLDPTVAPENSKDSLRGHLEAGAEKVIVSAPFKIQDKSLPIPEDAVTTVMGVNEHDYDPRTHQVISNASCTTTCLAHMVKPLIDFFGSQRILTASMATVHAVTGSQQVLDRLPNAGATDLRKNRSILNNIILTTTGAANTLALVIPEMKRIGFIAESVRIPSSTGSLVILVINLQEEPSGEFIGREVINTIYRDAARQDARKYLQYTEQQNVSSDIIGRPRCATLIEGHETHTRSAEVEIDLGKCVVEEQGKRAENASHFGRIAITQAVIYGWYDNELGCYVNMLGDRTVSIAEQM
jgi:glyceraldehyde 3-phosphate dehydrogenase